MNKPTPPTFRHASFRGMIGMASCDITPPIGIYSRTWGAASHDTAESVHRPLTLSAMVIGNESRTSPLVLVSADLSFWKSATAFPDLHSALLKHFSLAPEDLIFSVSHTHAAPPLMTTEEDLPGKELLHAWILSLTERSISTIQKAMQNQFDGILDWDIGHCNLATVRDFPDPDGNRYLCGYSPDSPADNTLLVGRVSDSQHHLRATLVNYACHPTTLAWENKAISPDYIGAMRETIERETKVPNFFLLGACGELAPRYQYTGDTGIADKHGRQLGYAALSVLMGMEPPGTQLTYTGVVESGAPLAIWKHEERADSTHLSSSITVVDIPLKDWPTADELERQQIDCADRALQERLRRKRAIRVLVGDGASYPLPLQVWRLGDTVLIGSSCEFYSKFQTQLREHFKGSTIICMNIINGSVGYLPPAELYDHDIYPVWQTPFDRGGLEVVTDVAISTINHTLKQ